MAGGIMIVILIVESFFLLVYIFLKVSIVSCHSVHKTWIQILHVPDYFILLDLYPTPILAKQGNKSPSCFFTYYLFLVLPPC